MRGPLSLSRSLPLSLVGLSWLLTSGCGENSPLSAGVGDSDPNGASAMADLNAELQEAARARASDPAWKPSEKQIAVIQVATGEGGSLNNFCLDDEGRVLACVGKVAGEGPAAKEGAIEVLGSDGARVTTWAVGGNPQAICRAPDGTYLIGGGGQLLRVDKTGQVLQRGKTPVAETPLPPDADLKELAQRFGDGPLEARMDRLKELLRKRRSDVTGIAAMGEDVFVAVPSPKDFTYVVYRVDREFADAKLVVEKLSGCCSQMDIHARDGKLWVANNGRHRVQVHDREGKLLTSIGRQDRKAADGFGGCCEPKNLRLLGNGEILTAESGPPVAIKRFAADGKFLGVLALPEYSTDCVRSTVEVSPDGARHYILNPEGRSIHVFAAKP